LGHLTCKIVSEMTYTSVEWDVKPNDTIPLCNGQCQLLQSISGWLGGRRLWHDLTQQLVQQLQHLLMVLMNTHQWLGCCW